jgi:hypothetical protein
MWIFRWKALEKIQYKSKILSWVNRYYHQTLNKRFGTKYEQLVFANFYEDANHPFHSLSVTAHNLKAASTNRKSNNRYKDISVPKPQPNIRSYFDK